MVIPGKINDFHQWVNNLFTKEDANQLAWHIDAAEITAFSTLLVPYEAAFGTAYGPDTTKANVTKTQRQDVKDTKKPLLKFARTNIQVNIIRNSFLSDAEVISCGCERPDPVKTPGGKPKWLCQLTAIGKGVGHLRVKGKVPPLNEGAKPTGKPDSHLQFVVFYKLDGLAPKTFAEYTQSRQVTSSKVDLLFDPVQDKNKVVYLIGAWVSSNGKIYGDFSEMIVSAVP